MEHLFLDTDILIDFLGDRKPFSKFSAQLFIKGQKKKYKLYTSGNSITTAYYILCKSLSERTVRELIPTLLKHVELIPINEKVLLEAVQSDFKDFEDAVQHASALTENRIKCIVTRNLRDYKKSKLTVLSPEEMLKIS